MEAAHNTLAFMMETFVWLTTTHFQKQKVINKYKIMKILLFNIYII